MVKFQFNLRPFIFQLFCHSDNVYYVKLVKTCNSCSINWVSNNFSIVFLVSFSLIDMWHCARKKMIVKLFMNAYIICRSPFSINFSNMVAVFLIEIVFYMHVFVKVNRNSSARCLKKNASILAVLNEQFKIYTCGLKISITKGKIVYAEKNSKFCQPLLQLWQNQNSTLFYTKNADEVRCFPWVMFKMPCTIRQS